MLGELYSPTGLALETARAVLETPFPHAVNVAKGCSNQCRYCYGPKFMHCGAEAYKQVILPKKAPLELVENQLKSKLEAQGVFTSFLTDPLLSVNRFNTEQLAQALVARGIRFATLSKIGVTQIDRNVRSGMTIVSLDDEFWRLFEPNAVAPSQRLDMLKSREYPWISMEPYPPSAIYPQDFGTFLEPLRFVKLIVFGKWNYNTCANTEEASWEYKQNIQTLKEFCRRHDIRLHVKSDTLTFAEVNL